MEYRRFDNTIVARIDRSARCAPEGGVLAS